MKYRFFYILVVTLACLFKAVANSKKPDPHSRVYPRKNISDTIIVSGVFDNNITTKDQFCYLKNYTILMDRYTAKICHKKMTRIKGILFLTNMEGAKPRTKNRENYSQMHSTEFWIVEPLSVDVEVTRRGVKIWKRVYYTEKRVYGGG
jgi:hypothetical protein